MDQKTSNPIAIRESLTDPQILLSRALANRNIQEFRSALEIGAQPLATDDQHLSVFEKALQTPGCAEFVEECLKTGCDPNYINTYFNKGLINCATDSRDPQILKALLQKPGVKVDFKYSELTPLNSLAKNLKQENANDVFKCIQILLQYGASPNIADQREMTPLHYIVKNQKIDDMKKREFIQIFLTRADLDIDTYRMGELRTILKDKFGDLKLPEKQENHLITYHMLLTDLRNNDVTKFEKNFRNNLRTTNEEENLQLLIESIERGNNSAFDLLMASGVNYNKSLSNNNTALETSWVYGNWYALKKLLEKPDIKLRRDDHPLSCIVRKLNETSLQEFCDYWKCFYVLLDSDKIDINKFDHSRSTALHYAVKYRNTKAIKELLKKGADIGIKSKFDDLPIDGMSPELLEEHFNDCITSNGYKLGDESFEILIDFKNLIPQKICTQPLREVMTPITFMANSKEYRHLLNHPVITSVLFLKWHKLSLVFYVNFLLYLFYALSFITHAVLKYRESDYEKAIAISALCSWLGILYLIIRESLQFIMCPIRYITSITNYMEILLILLSIMSCKSIKTFNNETQRIIAVIAILFVAVELCLLVGSLPVSSISTHMLMLETVCKSFLKSFLLYSIFIITFTICFYIMHDKPSDNDPLKGEDKAKEGETNFNEFPNLLVSFSKTIVMLTGEFDASDLKLNTYYSQLIFLLFVFFMTIILFNLLNGLAVSDTQTIKDQAELNFIICRTHLLARYEQLVIERSKHTKSLVNRQPFISIFQFFQNLCPDYSCGSKITILPNDGNKIIIPTLKSNKSSKESSNRKINENKVYNETIVPLTNEDLEMEDQKTPLPCCFSFITGNCSKMDVRTVKFAMAVLEKKLEEKIECRLESMDEKLEKILKHISGQKT